MAALASKYTDALEAAEEPLIAFASKYAKSIDTAGEMEHLTALASKYSGTIEDSIAQYEEGLSIDDIKQFGREVDIEDVILMADLALSLKDLDLTQFKLDFKNAFELSLKSAFEST
jgi:hypothetical protein